LTKQRRLFYFAGFVYFVVNKNMKRIAVYCGSNPGARPDYAAAAQALGALLAREKIELVYGGGRVGLMGVVADAVLKHGGHVIGVIPEKLVIKEVVHEQLPDLRVVKTMHERKALMAELADGFIALPGGYGTFEELFEVLAWGQLGWHAKPFGLLDVAGFYRRLQDFLDHARDEGFIRPPHRALVLAEDSAEKILSRMKNFRPPNEVKWVK
jgi:uncharacterized protein (TIGR00730 family)